MSRIRIILLYFYGSNSLFYLLNYRITTAYKLYERREQGLDYREGEQLFWCPFCSNSLWQGWSCGQVHFSGEKCHWPDLKSAGLFWRNIFLNSLSNPNPNPLANQLWSIDFLTSPTPLIIPHRLPAFLEFLMPLKNWCSIHVRWSKSSLRNSIRFFGTFSKFRTEFYFISFF